MADTIGGGISDVVNVLDKIRNNTTVAQERIDLQRIIGVLFGPWNR